MCLFPHFVRSHLKFTLRTNKTFVSNHSNHQAEYIQTILIIDLGFSHRRSAARELHYDHEKVLVDIKLQFSYDFNNFVYLF